MTGSLATYVGDNSKFVDSELENGEHVYNKYDVPAGDPLPATGGIGAGTFCALSGSLLAVSFACLIVLLKKRKRSHPG